MAKRCQAIVPAQRNTRWRRGGVEVHVYLVFAMMMINNSKGIVRRRLRAPAFYSQNLPTKY
jgi:hypothetical protein